MRIFTISATGVLVALTTGAIAPVAADPLACARITDPAHKAAIAAAEARISSHWIKSGARWIASYQLKPPAPMPLGMGSFKGAEALGASTTSPSKPIQGLAAISTLDCTTYEVGPGPAYVVRFSGRNLTFNENGQGWSHPVPTALLEVFDVEMALSSTANLVMADPNARTALPPDAELAAPPAGKLPASGKRK